MHAWHPKHFCWRLMARCFTGDGSMTCLRRTASADRGHGRTSSKCAIESALADESPSVQPDPAIRLSAPAATLRLIAANETITFTRHVAPIFWKNCAQCHRPGAVAPFPLLTYKDAVRRADFICDVVSSGQMPPWKPHSGAGVFREAPRLSPRRERAIGGLGPERPPEGDPADLPPTAKIPGWLAAWRARRRRHDARAIYRPRRPAETFIRPLRCRLNSGTTSSSTASSFVPETGESCTTAGSIWTRPATHGA